MTPRNYLVPHDPRADFWGLRSRRSEWSWSAAGSDINWCPNT